MKRHNYTIKFNASQQDNIRGTEWRCYGREPDVVHRHWHTWEDIEVLMYKVSEQIDRRHQTFVGNNILTGQIVEVSSTLSEDGLTLVVERDWTDNAHSDWEALNIDIVTPVEALDIVVSCVHNFTDI
jgi:hypothetical protein